MLPGTWPLGSNSYKYLGLPDLQSLRTLRGIMAGNRCGGGVGCAPKPSRASRTQEEELRKRGSVEGQRDLPRRLLYRRKSFRNILISTYANHREGPGPAGAGKYMYLDIRNCTLGTRLLRNPCPWAKPGAGTICSAVLGPRRTP